MLQNCFVCLEEKSKFKKLNCVHSVCTDCYDNLVKFNLNLCPICRTEFMKKTDNKIDDEDDDGEILIIELYEVIYRRRRRNITREEKLFNKAKAKQLDIIYYNKKKGRLSKLTNCF